MHISDGEIRAYLDKQPAEAELQRIQAHLDGCARCRERAEALSARAAQTAHRFSALEPSAAASPLNSKQARRAFERRLAGKQKEQTMGQRITTRAARPLWVGLAVIAVLAVVLAFPPVRAIANDFLGLFRVEQVSVVQVDYRVLSGRLGSSSQIENLMTNNMQVERSGEDQPAADAAQAAQLAGFAVRLPAAAETQPQLIVQPGGQAVFDIDLELVRGVLKELGQDDLELPDTLDGAQVTVDIPTSVVANYGDCPDEEELKQRGAADPDDPHTAVKYECTALLQMPSPSVNAPPDLNIQQIGQAYLQILGMEAAEAQHFAENVDWATTFVIPIPREGTSYKDVSVDGVTGTLITHYSKQYILVWLKDGLLYALSGPGDAKTALKLAETLR